MFINGDIVEINEHMHPDIWERRSRVILVDDSSQFLAFSQEFLSEYSDIEVVGVARNAQAALELLGEKQVHVMVLDLAMPEKNGIELTAEIKKKNPRQPVIILSMMDSPSYRQAAKNVGADAFVSKSAMYTHLVPTIRRLVAQQNQDWTPTA